MEPIRILVTGWRDWPEEDKYLIWETLNEFVARGEAGTSYVLVTASAPMAESTSTPNSGASPAGSGSSRIQRAGVNPG